MTQKSEMIELELELLKCLQCGNEYNIACQKRIDMMKRLKSLQIEESWNQIIIELDSR